MKLGFEKAAMIRLRAGVSFALAEAMDDGHCGLPTEELIPLAEELLEAPAGLIRAAVELERSEGTLVPTMSVTRPACSWLGSIGPSRLSRSG
jgi:exodeoxyribonuclease V alpha subunit